MRKVYKHIAVGSELYNEFKSLKKHPRETDEETLSALIFAGTEEVADGNS